MSRRFAPIELKALKTYPLAERKSKVTTNAFAKIHKKGNTFKGFLRSLPKTLAGNDIRSIISAIVAAHRQKNTIVLGIGAHVIKVGLNPIVIDLMERGIVSAVAMNGAGIIHDLELAIAGRTSEDVDTAIENGSFGMARETAIYLREAIRKTERQPMGLGEAIGRTIVEKALPQKANSILATGAALDIPVTVHVAFGTDIVHMHPEFDPKLTGAATHTDFRIFSSVISTIEGGVYLNIGSAVILPEVFLKALTLARNLGFPLKNITTVNMDFIQHYRPITNVVQRPTLTGGKGYKLVGHHEIMLPLVAAGVIEEIGA
jgi:hypothetical protein